MARADVIVRIMADARDGVAGVEQMADRSGRLAGAYDKARTASKAVLGGIAAVGKLSFDQASKLQQSAGAVESVFGRSAGAVKKLAGNAAQTVGLAQSEYNDLAAVLGSQLGNLGISQGKLVGTTDTLIKTGADLAATFGGTTSEAVEALSSLMRGETDPIEKYGISIKQADIQARLAAKGQAGLTGKAKTAAETQAKLALVMEQSKGAQGAFAREANTAAGQQQRATAELKNAGAAIGTALLPMVSKAAQWLAKLSQIISEHPAAFQRATVAVGLLAAVILSMNTVMAVGRAVGAAYSLVMGMIAAKNGLAAAAVAGNTAATVGYTLATKAMAAGAKVAALAQGVLNAVMSANPVALVVLAIVALVAILVVAYKKSDTFRSIVQTAMRGARIAVGWVVSKIGVLVTWVKTHAPAAWQKLRDKVQGVATRIRDFITRLRQAIVDRWNAIRDKGSAAWQRIRDKVQGVATRIRDFITRLRQAIVDRWNAIRERAARAWDGIRDKVAGVKARIAGIVETLRSAITAKWQAIKDRAAAAWDGVTNKVESVKGSIATKIESVRSTIVGKFKSAKDSVTDILDALWNPIQNIIDKINAAITAAGKLRDKLPSNPFSSAPGAFTATPAGSPSGTAVSVTVNMNVNATDPGQVSDELATAIEKRLAAIARRKGRR